MWRLSSGCVAAIVSTLIPSIGFSADAAIRAPVNCLDAPSCGKDFSIEDALRIARAVNGNNLEPMVDHNDCNDHIYNPYFWAEVDRFKDGERVANRLLERAATGQVFGEPYTQRQIVETSDSTQANSTLHYVSLIMG